MNFSPQVFIVVPLCFVVAVSLSGCSLFIGTRQCSPYTETVLKNAQGEHPRPEQISSCNMEVESKTKEKILQYCQNAQNSVTFKDEDALESCRAYITTSINRGPWNDHTRPNSFEFNYAAGIYQKCMDELGYARQETGRIKQRCYRTSAGW